MRSSIRRSWILLILGATAVTIAASGFRSAPPTATDAPSSSSQRVSGGTATFAELPGTPPDYIFPMVTLQYFSANNSQDLQFLLYRPLYFFGKGTAPVLNTGVSLAYPPVYSDQDKTVTVTLKPYLWSDGTPVTTADIQFWQNLVTANKSSWADYAPGFYPDNVQSANIVSPTTMVFHLTSGVNPQWFTANELSQITPLPVQSMDRTSTAGPVSRYDETPAGAVKVFNFLSAQSKIMTSFTTSPIWTTVDGPWKLQSFSTTGRAVFIPNKTYSGPIKPSLSTFVELPFTSDAAELNEIRSGAVDVGYLPYEDLTQQSQLASAGYRLAPWDVYYANYFAANEHNPTVGAIFRQPYMRRAMEMLIDQKGINASFYKGNANPTCGPIPQTAGDPYTSTYESSCPYSYNPAKARALLAAHGWTIVPNGVSSCKRAGSAGNECGPGVKAGAKLQFNFVYANTNQALAESVQVYKADAAKVGIQYNLSSQSFAAVSGLAVPCTANQSSCQWDIGDWGEGWLYTPDYYPTGEELFAAGAGGNTSNYADSTANALVKATTEAGATQATLARYENYIASQVPFIWQPAAPYQLSEIKSTLGGATPQNIYDALLPEDWYFTK